METTKIALFKGKKIRKVLQQGEWWFSVVDVVEALTNRTHFAQPPPTPIKSATMLSKGRTLLTPHCKTLCMRTKRSEERKKSQRPAPVYNTLPIKVTRKEFNQYILSHLKLSKRQKPRLSYFKIFNHILYVLHTGIQWESLPVLGIHWSGVYRHHNRWSKDGSYKRIFDGSLDFLAEKDRINLAVLHGDGSNVVVKKGVHGLVTRDTSTNEVKKPLISKTIQATVSSRVLRRV